MNALLAALTMNINLTGTVSSNVTALLVYHGCYRTVEHSARVAAAARQIAKQYDVDQDAAETAGWLHDISAIIPVTERVHYAEAWGIAVLPQERQVPMIVHQKLSAYIAQHGFHISDPSVLSAIGCHTTLRPDASLLDTVVFIADKLQWDGNGDPPYKDALEHALHQSLDVAIHWFLSYLWQRRTTLLVIHPWLAAAYADVVVGNTEHAATRG